MKFLKFFQLFHSMKVSSTVVVVLMGRQPAQIICTTSEAYC